VAGVEGKLIGLAVGIVRMQTPQDLLSERFVKYGRIPELYVDPAWRSKGLGSQLMAELEKYFREMGCGYVCLDKVLPTMYGRMTFTCDTAIRIAISR